MHKNGVLAGEVIGAKISTAPVCAKSAPVVFFNFSPCHTPAKCALCTKSPAELVICPALEYPPATS